MQSIITIAGNGRKAAGPDGGQAVDTPLLTPRNVAVDAAGNLYVADSMANRIRKITPNGIITTVAGNGSVGFSGSQEEHEEGCGGSIAFCERIGFTFADPLI